MSTSPLKSRSVNTSPQKPSSSSSTTDAEKPKSMEYHRQVLQSRLEEDKNKHTYVSPSDMIMSPATKKLEVLKGKRFGKPQRANDDNNAIRGKGQSLFANTTSRNAQQSGSLDQEAGKFAAAEGQN